MNFTFESCSYLTVYQTTSNIKANTINFTPHFYQYAAALMIGRIALVSTKAHANHASYLLASVSHCAPSFNTPVFILVTTTDLPAMSYPPTIHDHYFILRYSA
jgi:hypothetical protein